ncbi:beta-1,3-galactosyltransferase 1-like [Branchiostoma lanceolatum]|uniref:beta-1,3-galactosyltransferase 1-like n=1 Tax=Branchiostoma lanceolatum TaxID=7740 RepID=UPI003451D3A5
MPMRIGSVRGKVHALFNCLLVGCIITISYQLHSLLQKCDKETVSRNLFNSPALVPHSPLVLKSGVGSSLGSEPGGESWPQSSPVVNQHPYHFVLEHPDKCKNQDVFLLIIVTTSPKNYIQRQDIRRTWANESNIPGVVIKRVFAVGQPHDPDVQQAIEQENAANDDIIQENFIDAYRNLSTKAIMGLKWAFTYCPNARFVLKTDDDVFVNPYRLMYYLRDQQSKNASKLVTGWVYTGGKPVRDPNSPWKKWFVTMDEYPRDRYPNYADGFAYVVSNDITKALYETSLTTRYLFVRDAFIGLCMEKLGIHPRHHDGFRLNDEEVKSCSFERVLAAHLHVVETPDMMNTWRALNSNCSAMRT